MKSMLRGASSAAMILGLAGIAPAWAQTPTPQTVTTTTTADQPPASGSNRPDQVTTPEEAAANRDRVVVTGSLLITAPEDQAKPVESYNFQELKEAGAPSVSEFVRDLSINYDSSLYGGADPGVGGDNKANLRGIGDTATLVLLNGRTLSTDNGFGADLSTIPENALAAVDVLKDGASTTYGAGAVAGVINYRTRRDINAPELSIEKRMYDGSDGEYTIDFQTGWVGDAGNLLVTYSYEHADALRSTERRFSSLPFNVNPDAYTLNGGQPGNYLLTPNFYTARAVPTPAAPGAPTTITYTNPPNFFDLPGGINDHNNPLRRIEDYGAPAGCTAIGGALVQSLLPGDNVGDTSRLNQTCALPAYWFTDLVNEAEQHQIYSELNFDITDTMAMQVSATYSTSNTINRGSPSPAATNAATLGYSWTTSATQTALNAGLYDDTTCAGACNFVIPVAVQTFNAAGNPTGTYYRNPYIDSFIQRTGSNPTAFVNNTALYTGAGWRPFLFGGNGHTDDGYGVTKNQTERMLISGELNGEFASDGWDSFLNGINYKHQVQYNLQIRTAKGDDILTSRLQNALLGYGGPGCEAFDRVATNYGEIDPVPNSTTVATQNSRQNMRARFNNTIGVQSDVAPGTNGCLWFNPFVSSFQTSIANGATNPNYVAGHANPQELIDWLFYERQDETQRSSFLMDTFYSGKIPESLFSLPGGEIGWGAGINWRQTELRNSPAVSTENNDFELQACAFPDPYFLSAGASRKPRIVNTAGTVTTLEPDQYQGGLGCTALGTGPGAFITGNPNLPNFTDEQTLSYYAEVALPILDTLNGSLSWRNQSFNNRRIEGDIYSAALKWDITDEFYVRGSYSTNFRAVPELNETPGRIEIIDRFQLGRFANTPIIRLSEIDTTLQPEDDTTINIGVGYQNNDFFGGRFRAALDFWEILIEGEVVGGAGTAGLTAALEKTFTRNSDGSGGVPVTAAEFDQSFANCAAPTIILWEFGTGACQQGSTRGADTIVFKSLTTNGAGYITNGLDYTLSYSMPLYDGNLSFDLRATQTMHYKDQGYTQFGVPIEGPRNLLGFNAGGGGRAREWRGNFTTRWANDEHTISLRVNYDSEIVDRDYLACTAPYWVSGVQISEPGGSTCGVGLNTVAINPVTGDRLPGAAGFSDYGFRPGDRITYDVTWIYDVPFIDDMDLRASILNITDEDPFPLQAASGYATGDPRGRIFEIELSKKF